MSLPIGLVIKSSTHNCTGKQILMQLVFQKPVNAEPEELKGNVRMGFILFLFFSPPRLPCMIYVDDGLVEAGL
jgi:hypothetical protein